MLNKVTAIILNWKRPKNIPRIVEHLLSQDFIKTVIVHNNSVGKNVLNYGRYLYPSDIIYTQDDDCIVHNIKDIWEGFKKDPTRIHYGATERLLNKEKEVNGRMCLMGWGSFFKRGWMLNFKKYTDKYGKDECFYRETDRIFSILQGKKHKMYNGGIEHLDGYLNKNALSEQSDHLKYKILAIKRSIEL